MLRKFVLSFGRSSEGSYMYIILFIVWNMLLWITCCAINMHSQTELVLFCYLPPRRYWNAPGQCVCHVSFSHCNSKTHCCISSNICRYIHHVMGVSFLLEWRFPSVGNVLVVWRAPLCEQHNYQNYCTDIPMCDVASPMAEQSEA